jgi:hypothetical protein
MNYHWSSNSRANALKLIIRDFISVYDCQGNNGFFRLYFDFLSDIEQKILFSHVVDAWDYEWYCESEKRLQQGVSDKANYIQSLLDKECEEYSIECFHERGIFGRIDPDTGETRWIV